jgi:RNA polymerase sigma-70 factor (ECF subfamily)
MTEDESLDDLIARLNEGDINAAERIFYTYEPYLRMTVSRQLSGALRSKLDTMDIVQSVWTDVLAGFHQAGWHFADRAHLRAFLITLARNRLIDRRRHYRKALERERPLAEADPQALPPSGQPRPSEIAQGHELWDRLVAECPPAHRELLQLKRQGLPLAEIATRTGLHPSSVRRILYDLARRMADSQEPAQPTTSPAV